MKITRLELTNFRAARGLTVELAPRVLVSGLNGVGKTSVREAIRWCLRGVCDATDLKGAGAEALIPVGAREVSVSLVLDGLGTVTRTFAEHGGTAFSVEGFTGTSGVQQQALLNRLGTSAAFLDACLETDTFFRLHHADAKALVLSLLNVKVKIPVTADMAGEGLPVYHVDYTLDELDIRYKQAFEDRKDLKRRLQTAAVGPAPTLPEAVRAAQERIGGGDVVEAASSRIKALRDELGAQERAVGEVLGKRSVLTLEQTRLQALITSGIPSDDGLAMEIAQLEQQLATLSGAPVGETPTAKTLQVFRSTIEALSTHKPPDGCVIDGNVPCKTPAKAFKDRAAALTAQLDALPTEGLPASDRTAVARLQQRIESLHQQIQDGEKTRQAISAAHLRLDTLGPELAALPSTDAQEREIQTLRERIRKGEELVQTAQAYNTALKTHQQQIATRQTLEQELAVLETRVEMLGPKGLRVVALAEAMGKFEGAINTLTDAWGWQVQIQAEPWTVLANGRPVETYSRSERYRLGIAIQLAVAQLSGLSFAVIDEMDLLDAQNRKVLNRMVNQAPLEQILVLGTREPTQPLPPPMEGWAFYRLGKDANGWSIVEEAVPAAVPVPA